MHFQEVEVGPLVVGQRERVEEEALLQDSRDGIREFLLELAGCFGRAGQYEQ